MVAKLARQVLSQAASCSGVQLVDGGEGGGEGGEGGGGGGSGAVVVVVVLTFAASMEVHSRGILCLIK